ncbi:hypothetical protein NK356_21130 [Chryseobacterium sp. S0630]|uniref:hypothetical protein n=1 Tax=unclassified Chryseobacterium TaxID=2593645 RepID=UPI0020A141B9|nr:hypothetical protein [Chryseobacterium sp. S0630]MCP1301684.1 hypothetical protein [Chryseobacterium sp. S0630]
MNTETLRREDGSRRREVFSDDELIEFFDRDIFFNIDLNTETLRMENGSRRREVFSDDELIEFFDWDIFLNIH